ncbi:MoaD family protein [Candidatus Bathyarchaeota archaeon]|nr:MoaD family protein [Candidatus Bathyarchaeota archaeon]
MRIKARFFTILREMTGKKEEILTVGDGTTVKEILDLLSEKHGNDFSEYIFKGRRLRSHIQILLNGISITTLNGLDTRLEEDSTLAIVPPVGGGI